VTARNLSLFYRAGTDEQGKTLPAGHIQAVPGHPIVPRVRADHAQSETSWPETAKESGTGDEQQT
jgi:hypothetical protein